MGFSVYCRTCAVPPRDLADGMIDIFANAKITTLLSIIKEWQLDIMQDDGLSQCICKKCELALIKINTFRLQALSAKKYLQTRLYSLETTAGGGEAIDDNENDLHTNYGGVEMHNRETLPRTLQSEYTSIQMCKKTINIFNSNEKVSEKEQSNHFKSSLDAVVEERGELSFESNIEPSRPHEFQVILIEEEEESTQWINEDENAGIISMGIIECEELNTGKKNSSAEAIETHPINWHSFTKPSKNKSTDFMPNKRKLRNRKQDQKGKYYEIKSNEFSKVSSLADNNTPGTQFHFVPKETTIKEIVPIYEKVSDKTLEDPAQISDSQTLLATISSGSFEQIRESSPCSADDLQSVLMNQLTLQMINANFNILEGDLQIDDFDTLLAAVDEQASLGSINNKDKYSSSLKNERNILKINMGCCKGIQAPNMGEKSLIQAASHSDKESKEFLREMNEIAIPSQTTTRDPESKFINHTSSGNSNKLVYKKKPLDNSIVNYEISSVKATSVAAGSSNKITTRSLRCRLCVYNVSDQPVFATKEMLDSHIAIVHDDKERPYNCPQCAARYRTRSGCVAHINAIHLKKGDKCELCDKTVVGGAGQMRMHIERNHTHGNYTCEICHMELRNISLYNFKYHKRWHNEDKLWRCELCGKAFVTRTHLIEHKVTHTRQGEFLCTRCGKRTRSKWELRTHLFAIHGEGEAPLKCNYCDEKFTQHVQKRAHLERYHPMELAKRIVSCSKCEKHFSTETNLQRHIKQQHNEVNADIEPSDVLTSSPPQYEGFMCAHCPRKYRSKYALIKHLRVHAVMADRPYSCPDCEMHFKHFSELDRHDLQHHATVRPYKCDKCVKAFATKTALKIHGQVHEVKGRNFRCPECNQRFKFEKSLSLHIISHKTMRHSCEICKKSYIRLTQLKTHKNRYHKKTSETEEE
ncbi:PR domain zinc finger protein 5 isoform X1 [Bactrocera oleae]|uniref:PR domain zinc finger protein 5 isoform X1 n=1 Tax=Bactrocera oleae TaxID=104688 RepID=UPI00174D4B56|nr:zinc finger protein 37-like isoform X1 [Bactrocera oleae]XP_036233120.1 zinc finger protein 37-like isoform X1 [Bactrocera oleae]XP_036233121.1 zinc finger protein 37-like isoform X1 [Bactrocera oleae]XP_036233122.1 zinc finger protein 37-like isoform X1 [Bactrocera oleae]